ncbi:MAG: penicillin-binding protein 2 [Alphaproteobacteria bacterium]
MMEPDEPVEDRWGPWRARLVAGALGLVFTVIVGRSAQVALAGDASEAHQHARAELAHRADIVDRRGDLLATTLPGYSLAANPGAIWDAKDVATRLAAVLPGLDVGDLTRRLSDRDKQFVWVQRGLTPKQRKQVFDLGLEGLRFQEERIRVYPGGHLAGHLLGFANVDGKGVDGVEHIFDTQLAKGGDPLKLTIDAGVQYALEAELDRAAEDFTMEGAAGIVIDASNGAVRAIASWPAIDPNHPTERSDKARPNRAMNSVFELGSIYKPLTVAAALDAGQLTPTDTFDVSAPIKVGAATIHDEHVFDHAKAVTATDIIAYSSNVGAVQIGQRLGPARLKAFLGQVGLLGRPTYDGPPSAAPLTPAEWDPLTSATVSFGHGIAVTPFSFAMSYVPFANGGNFLQPLFVEPTEGAEIKRKRVISPETVRIVLGMMRQTVLVGTGKLADAAGYEVAGKTGTAEKPGPDGYDQNANITSFAAVFPASRPQFVVLVVLDNAQPKVGDQRTAAYTSASIVGRLIARAAPLLDVHPVLAKPVEAPAAPELRVASESRSL